MSATATAVEKHEGPVDPGCLPAWEVGEMPAPAPVERKNLLALIGPAIVMVGGTIGTGEWVVGSGVAKMYGGALLWVAPLAIISQVILNTEVMRYTLVTGEPAFTGFMRSKPGPRFWLIFYLFLDIIGWMPALAGLAAQILLFTFTQADPDPNVTKYVAVGLLLLCGILLCFGGKIYNTLEFVLGGKVIFVLLYMLFVCVAFVPWSMWLQVAGGMVNPFWVPENVDWTKIGAIAGFAGIGGMGNILASNYVREKGWGMGAKVGAIGSAVGGAKIELSHIGVMAEPTEEARSRFRRWWKFIQTDQFGLWAVGSVIGMFLPCLLGAQYLKMSYFSSGQGDYKAALGLALDFGGAIHPAFVFLTLLCGFIILFPGQFSSMDGIARRWCDAVWSGSSRARKADPSKARYLYYTFVAIYVSIGIFTTLTGVRPTAMMVFNANLANLAITCCIVHTLYVNSRFLPAQFKPTKLKRVLMVFAACFYFSIFALSVSQTIDKAQKGTLFPPPTPAPTSPAPAGQVK